MNSNLKYYVATLFLMSFFAPAQDFFVATTGNDGNPGTQAQPWATITHALGNVPDGATIQVMDGTYEGTVTLVGDFTQGVLVRAQNPLQAVLENQGPVVVCTQAKGITLQGFEMRQTTFGGDPFVVEIRDGIGEPGGTDAVERITLTGNVIHDSFSQDIVRIHGGAREIAVRGNVFYNQGPQTQAGEHVEINGANDISVSDNVFFNDFEGSGRVNTNSFGSFVIVKNSEQLSTVGDVDIRRNIFLNWQGFAEHSFITLGDEGLAFHEAVGVTIENNLMLGNATHIMRSSFVIRGGSDILIRNNTISGDLPCLAYTVQMVREGQNPVNDNVRFINNIWSDQAGTFGSRSPGDNQDFSDTPVADTNSFTLNNNLYFNDDNAIPFDQFELINMTDDANAIEDDPLLMPPPENITLPRWNGSAFLSGATSIRAEFERLATTYGTPGPGSAVIGAGAEGPGDDLFGNTRGSVADVGAVEVNPCGAVIDLDGDNDLDLDDLYLMASRWTSDDDLTDLDDDNRVTVLDMTELENHRGSCD
ncbi:putative pectate lyase C [Sulfidibacter corallicola]|uniref:Probable pectate lyase C n=1 Tax=Sulfidibacter corallicola TaxID=2818388 RepID=A0A8A4TY33_SULCO|nr:right-handed parallel beta-helix repeat-containing protein [Sulfidibacter corallicola]QTD53872.1 hypothetical protein J3U87_15600 [Sulfidibacter corallicola]